MKLIPLVALAAILLATPVLAMEPTMPRSPKTFAKLDTNSDGKVTVEEFLPKAKARLLRLDGDKNGEVTAAEIDVVLMKALNKRRAQVMKTLDADGNGAITQAELDQYVELLLNAADTDDDGGVTLKEAKSFKIAKMVK